MDFALKPGSLSATVAVSEKELTPNTMTSMIVVALAWLVFFICEAQRQILFTRNVLVLSEDRRGELAGRPGNPDIRPESSEV